jgi:SWI/SNF-related matrix-associated actin-dependent regulator of chromatin subfamily A3
VSDIHVIFLSILTSLSRIAHTIQNSQSHLSQACCALRSMRRWAITGTPIQNKLPDFASIVRFLQVYPYADQETFEQDILKPWQNRQGTDLQGFLRLKALVRAIAISRTKAVVNLPPRLDEIHHLNFAGSERKKYESVKFNFRALLEEAISSSKRGGKPINTLWLLNVLRLVCNHGVLTQHSLDRRSACTLRHTPANLPWAPNLESEFKNILHGTGACQNCGDSMLEDLLEEPATFDMNCKSQISTMDEMICVRCSPQSASEIIRESPCSMLELPGSIERSLTSTPVAECETAQALESMSTKIKALVADLCRHYVTEKRFCAYCLISLSLANSNSVVFSYWTSTLDFIQMMLDHKGIVYTRIDGKTSLLARNEAVRAFQNDVLIRVILVSITCGGAG